MFVDRRVLSASHGLDGLRQFNARVRNIEREGLAILVGRGLFIARLTLVHVHDSCRLLNIVHSEVDSGVVRWLCAASHRVALACYHLLRFKVRIVTIVQSLAIGNGVSLILVHAHGLVVVEVSGLSALHVDGFCLVSAASVHLLGRRPHHILLLILLLQLALVCIILWRHHWLVLLMGTQLSDLRRGVYLQPPAGRSRSGLSGHYG